MARFYQKVGSWLGQGVSPERLALSLALGLAIGCLPLVGLPTLICAAVALGLRLNLPAIQAANYAALPLQLTLIVPFVRLGGKLHTMVPQGVSLQPAMLLHTSPLALVTRMGGLELEALLGWAVIAVPAALLLTFGLTAMLRRVPATSRA